MNNLDNNLLIHINNQVQKIKKKIIQVWTQDVINLNKTKYNNYWGLGDLIRGTIKLYQLSKTYNYEFDISISKHPISKNLVYKSKFDNVLNNTDIKFIEINSVESYIEAQSDNLIYLLTNDLCDESNIDDDIINILKKLFIPNIDIQDEINTYLTRYNIKKIIHMRLGDRYIENNNLNVDIYINYLKNNQFDLLLTDSNILKQEAKKNNLPVIDFEIGHIGYNNDENILRNTLIEFLLLTKAEEIHTYSNYSWISGFVYWVTKIYKNKLVQITL
jgi:hypothetical protein